MKKIILCLLAGVFCFSLSVSAQGLKDVKINEVLVKNTDSYADDHANHVGWIELFNSGYSQVDVGGAFLKFVQGDKVVSYRIPKTDVRTKIAPQGYLIFFADGSSNKGTFHTNFRLDETDSTALEQLVGINDTIFLMDQSGKNAVDFVAYDVNVQVPNVSIGSHLSEDESEVIFGSLASVTPMQSNDTKERIPASELFRQQDQTGIVMAITAMSVVFITLVLLAVLFTLLGRYMHKVAAAKKAASEAPTKKAAVHVSENKNVTLGDINGEEIAAIAVALRRYSDDMHDIESEIITINRVARAYSPWSSKIYGLNNIMPNKK